MKQFIDVEQLKSVSDEIKIKLFRLYYEDTKDCEIKVTDSHLVCDRTWRTTYRNLAEGITIGKMMEIIMPYYPTICFTEKWVSLLIYSNKGKNYNNIEEMFDSVELCNALWEAVKYILDNDNS